MTEVVTWGLLLLVLWRLRSTQALRPSTWIPQRRAPAPTDFGGAVPPERYVVVRWPQGQKHYGGCIGAQARQVYEHQHPAPGERVEFWELGNRRGHKEG